MDSQLNTGEEFILLNLGPDPGHPDPEDVDQGDEEAAAQNDPDGQAGVVLPVQDGVDELVTSLNT